ncbi:MAG: FAD-dependent oxidoreductase, partial [Candidatus Poribacteria bacterium]|nr:FAD-dependent oxidoreductase [Candidatus Poribacteria bacterium]
MRTERYNAIVIGSGQAGKPLAIDLAHAGWRTAIIEKGPVGGTCVNVGCTPTKTMVASARVAYLARRSSDYGVQTGSVTVDMAKVRQRKQAIVDDFRDSSQERLETTEGLDLVFGEARFTGPASVEVKMDNGELRHLTAEKIIINTGARPTVPPVPGLDRVPTLDSSAILELETVPEHLIVLGGGYIG